MYRFELRLTQRAHIRVYFWLFSQRTKAKKSLIPNLSATVDTRSGTCTPFVFFPHLLNSSFNVMLQLHIALFWPLYGFIDRTASEMTGNGMRERVLGDIRQGVPGHLS